MKEQKNIDEIFKEAFDQFEVDPGADVWAKVQSGINSGAGASSSFGAAGSTSSSWVATAIVGLAISAAIVGGYYFFNQKGEAKVKAAIEANKKETKENTPINTKPTDLPAEEAEDSSLESLEKKAADSQIKVTSKASSGQKNPEIESQKEQTNPVRQLSDGSGSSTKTETLDNKVDGQSTSLSGESSTTSSSEKADIPIEKNTSITEESKIPVQATDQSTENSLNEKSDDSDPSSIAAPASIDEGEKVAVHIEFPTAFTPDQDGTNDKFIIIKELSKGLEQVQEARMQISNNTGKTVAVWKGIYGSWDGTLPDGSNAPKGNYLYQFVYSINGEAQAPVKGLIFLNR